MAYAARAAAGLGTTGSTSSAEFCPDPLTCTREHAATSAGGEALRASAVVLAPGHSARPLYQTLAARGVAMSAKPFALGFRIEHPQAWLDAAQYGEEDARGVSAAWVCLSFRGGVGRFWAARSPAATH
jgi:hypothetical protein